MSNYTVGLYDDRNLITNKELASRTKELTEFFIKHHGRQHVTTNGIITGSSVNEILNKAILNKDFEYCIIIAIGHFINTSAFFDYIENWIEKVDFFVTGHIIDKETSNSHGIGEQYWGLHKQCVVINLKYYKQFGCPGWGDKFATEESISVTKAERSITNIHDDYTPIFLNPTLFTQQRIPGIDGWNFINISLENGLKVYNFHPKIRSTKKYTYPDKSVAELVNQLGWINKVLSTSSNCIFFWNTEDYKDIPKTLGQIDTLYCVAAAFKPNYILHTGTFTENTKIVYYDYSKQALSFKKLLLTYFDGEDYPAFIRWANSKYKLNETTGNSTQNKSYESLWEKEIQRWKSIEIFKEHWYRYKTLQHKYLYCNILRTPDKLISTIDNTNSVIWWSNVFYTINAHFTRDFNELENFYINKWIKPLQEKNPNLVIIGKDYLNNRISNNISEYAKCLE